MGGIEECSALKLPIRPSAGGMHLHSNCASLPTNDDNEHLLRNAKGKRAHQLSVVIITGTRILPLGVSLLRNLAVGTEFGDIS